MKRQENTKAIENLCDNFIEKTMELNDIPGIVTGLYIGGNDIIRSAGVRYITDKDPLKPGDVFHCASVSKLLTATSIMMLVEEGALNLEDRLQDLLPELEIADDRCKDVKLYQMLSHTAGIADIEDYHWEEALTGKDALAGFVMSEEVRALPLLWEPGKGGFSYSNIAYEMLGHIVEKYSGPEYETYDDFVRSNILDPAGMSCSTMKTFERFGVSDGEKCPLITDMIRELNKSEGPCGYGMALPHERLEDRSIVPVKYYPYTRSHAPSSTLTSTASDLLMLGKAHMDGLKAAENSDKDGQDPEEKKGSGSLLTLSSYAHMIHEYATVPNNGEKMGLGWFMRERCGHRLYGHEGTDDGFRASFWICPEMDIVFTVLGNVSGASVKKIGNRLFEEVDTALKAGI